MNSDKAKSAKITYCKLCAIYHVGETSTADEQSVISVSVGRKVSENEQFFRHNILAPKRQKLLFNFCSICCYI